MNVKKYNKIYLIFFVIIIFAAALLVHKINENLGGKAIEAFTNNLILYHKFDSEAGTTAEDSSGFNNIGVVYGASWAAGYLNQSLSLDGMDDVVIINESVSLSPQNKITVQAWIYPKTNLGLHGILGNWFESTGVAYKEGYLLVQDDNKMGFYIGSGNNSVSVFSGPIINLANNWHHVAGIYDASTGQAKLYIDGVNVANESYSYDIAYGGSLLKIGAYSINTTQIIDNDGDGYNSDVDCNDNNPLINPGAAESCNNVDDNCNNFTDESLTQTCGIETGECKKGISICLNGSWQMCLGAITPKQEICDGKDNNCNNSTDEDNICLDNDGDRVFNPYDCNDYDSTIGECKGCAACTENTNLDNNNGNCLPNKPCVDIICPKHGVCGDYKPEFGCNSSQIARFPETMVSSCQMIGNNFGDCLPKLCSPILCEENSSCLLDSDNDNIPDAHDFCYNELTETSNDYGFPMPLMTKFTLTPNLSLADLRNLSDFEIGLDDKAKLNFKNRIKLFREESGKCKRLNFDEYINISEKKIEIKTENLAELNQTNVALTFYNITYISPRIYDDGESCSYCVIENYSDNTLTFNVTHFTVYEIKEGPYCGDGNCNNGESCSTCSSDCKSCPAGSPDSGGGGGGGGIKKQTQECDYSWECYPWGECINGIQTKICANVGSCDDSFEPPLMEKQCLSSINEEQEGYDETESKDVKSFVVEEIDFLTPKRSKIGDLYSSITDNKVISDLSKNRSYALIVVASAISILFLLILFIRRKISGNYSLEDEEKSILFLILLIIIVNSLFTINLYIKPPYIKNLAGNALELQKFSANGYFSGLIDEVKIYNYVRTDAEILADAFVCKNCSDNNGCCPEGCDSINDNDCYAQCGNSIIETGEVCDTTNITSYINCSNYNILYSGILRCSSDCLSYDTSNCTAIPTSICGNGIIEAGEVCDTTNLTPYTNCYSYNITYSGILRCSQDCLSYDTSNCTSSPASINYNLTYTIDFQQGFYENINDLNNGTIRIGGNWKKIGKSSGNYFAKASDKLYMIGGDDFEGGPNSITDELDPISYSLTHKSSMVKARDRSTINEVNGKIYAIGGESSRWIEEFNPLTNQWRWVNNSFYVHLGHSSQAYNGKIYFIGGDDLSGTHTTRTEVFDPATTSVRELASMIYGRDKYPTVLLNGKIYAIGGGATNTIEEYDIASNIWTRKNSLLPAPYLRYPKAHEVNNKIYILGGYEQSTIGGGKYLVYKNNSEFDPASDVIRQVEPMNYRRYRFGSVKINDFLYAISGNIPNNDYYNYTLIVPSNYVEMYDVSNNRWIYLKNISEGVRDFDTIVYGNKIFAVSGVNSTGSFVDTIQVYTLEKQGNFTSPLIDLGSNNDKLFNNLTINFEPLYENAQIELLYSIDISQFITAGTISGSGLETKTMDIKKSGKDITLKLILISDDVYLEQHSPVIKDITLTYGIIST